MDRPKDGKKKEYKGVTWIAHCGAWWSALAWNDLDASHMVARDGFNCGACSGLLISEDQREETVRAECSGHFENSLREPIDGEFIPFIARSDRDEVAPMVAPGESVKLISRVWEPFTASHLAFPVASLGCFTILSLAAGRTPLISGPISADYFVVRVPEDSVLPIDRGGPLIRLAVVLPVMPAEIHLHNDTNHPQRAICALYGHPSQAC